MTLIVSIGSIITTQRLCSGVVYVLLQRSLSNLLQGDYGTEGEVSGDDGQA